MSRRRQKPFALRLLEFINACLIPVARAQKRREKMTYQEAQKRLLNERILTEQLKREKMKADIAKQWNSVTLQDFSVDELREAYERKKKDQEYFSKRSRP